MPVTKIQIFSTKINYRPE